MTTVKKESGPLHRAQSRLDWVALATVLVVAFMLVTLSVLRFTGYNAGMLDIGNHAQAIWSVTQGRPLEYTREDGNVSRLSWHAEVIYFVAAGLYAIIPDPRTLLVFQALWFALGALPAYQMVLRSFGDPTYARILMLVYLLYPTAHTAVLFDLHGDTLAMPCLMFALNALDRSNEARYLFWIILAMLCKVYVAVPVGVLGVVLALRGRRRLGVATLVVSLIWFGVLMLLVRPAFSPSMQDDASARFRSYLDFYFVGLGNRTLAGTLGVRLATALLVLAPAMVFGRYAWQWMLPGLATALPALLSVGEGAAYDYRFHHYALPVPFFALAVIAGLDAYRHRRASSDPQALHKAVLFQGALVVLLFVLLVDTPVNPRFWVGADQGWGIADTKYGQTSRDRVKDTWLREVVPPDVPIATSDLLAPHVINRHIVYQVRYTGDEATQRALFLTHLDKVENVVVDALNDFAVDGGGGQVIGGVLHYLPAIVDLLGHPDFVLQSSRDGLLLFGRPAPTEPGLKQSLQVRVDADQQDPEFAYGEAIALLGADVQPLENCRFRLRFAWAAGRRLSHLPQLMAVSRLNGFEDARYPHLPTLTSSTQTWPDKATVTEEFDIELPIHAPSGVYELITGWYDTTLLASRYTDHQSRIGDERTTLTLECSR